MTQGDLNAKRILNKILEQGSWDENPRPHYEDVFKDSYYDQKTNAIYIKPSNGLYFKDPVLVLNENQKIKKEDGDLIVSTPAHTLFINHEISSYDYQKNETPAWTLRPIAWKSAVNEILWIYQMQSNKLSDLHDLGIHYWDQWDIGDGTIGCRYGATIKRHKLITRLLKGLKKDPFGRRHIMNMWQENDFLNKTGGTTKGLNPCCYETIWNCRRGSDGDIYLDVLLNQRSSDFVTSVSINELQYQALQLMIAKHLGYKPGVLTHVIENVQIYDRHIEAVKDIINREPIKTENPIRLVLDTDQTNFFKFTVDDFKLENYPLTEIKKNNPQIKLDLGI